MADLIVVSHADEIMSELERQAKAALEAVGAQAAGYAQSNVTEAGRVNTGALRNSISHLVEGDTVYIGTNNEYAIYNEMGTGIYIGGGRKSPWAYQDASGKWHRTRGMPGIHFLKNAASGHTEEYKAIMQQYLKGK